MVMHPGFHERQYLGFNRFGMLRRFVIILFCFVFYMVSGEEAGETAHLFFYLGLALLVINALAMLISHLDTTLNDTTLKLVGPITFRKVEMDVRGISSIEIKPYSAFLLNRPMFNLHRQNARTFYTHGKWCVEFTAPNGETVRLGSQRPKELKLALEEAVAKT